MAKIKNGSKLDRIAFTKEWIGCRCHAVRQSIFLRLGTLRLFVHSLTNDCGKFSRRQPSNVERVVFGGSERNSRTHHRLFRNQFRWSTRWTLGRSVCLLQQLILDRHAKSGRRFSRMSSIRRIRRSGWLQIIRGCFLIIFRIRLLLLLSITKYYCFGR